MADKKQSDFDFIRKFDAWFNEVRENYLNAVRSFVNSGLCRNLNL